VLKARAQIERLGPIVEDCDRHAGLAVEIADLRACRDALRGFFASHKAELLGKRIATLDADIARLDERIAAARDRLRQGQTESDGLKQAILENGGDRIAGLDREIAAREHTRQERQAASTPMRGSAGMPICRRRATRTGLSPIVSASRPISKRESGAGRSCKTCSRSARSPSAPCATNMTASRRRSPRSKAGVPTSRPDCSPSATRSVPR
jgi:hypothetical protein